MNAVETPSIDTYYVALRQHFADHRYAFRIHLQRIPYWRFSAVAS